MTDHIPSGALREWFITEVRQFLDRSGMDPRTLGYQAIKNHMFVEQLVNGADPRLSTVQKIVDFIRAHDQS